MKKRVEIRKYMQFRAEDLKSLQEQRNEAITQMKDVTGKAELEKRAFTEEETTQFDALEKTVKDLDATIQRLERARDLELNTVSTEKKEELKREDLEERAFDAYIRGMKQERADVNLAPGDNGAVIPSSIVNKIIKKVHDICPIYAWATKYNVGGVINVPYYDETTGNVTVAYATEFKDLASTNGSFKSIQLTGFLAGALSKISKSLINNSQFNLVDFVVNEMAASIARWIENEMLNGTTGKIEGLKGVTKSVTSAKATAISADDLIEVQEDIDDSFQAGAVWIMNKATRTAIRKLKDNEGRYILNPDATAPWGYTLFGKPVYTSENMAKMAAGKTAVYYGDFSGLAIKLTEDMNIEILREVYAAQHAVGAVGWLELDGKVEDAQKITKLVMAAS